MRFGYGFGNAVQVLTPPFGAKSAAGYLLDKGQRESAGFAVDFVSMDCLARGGPAPFSGNPNGKLTYTSPSTKWITDRHGVLSGGTTLRCDHDASTLDTSATTHDSLGVGNGGVVRKTLTTSGAVTYVAGQDIVASDASDITKWMAGRVVSYAGGSLVVDFRAASGYFACSSWKIIVALGVLIEEQRTNLLSRSNEFTVSPWTTAQSGVAAPVRTANAGTSPDGLNNASKIDFPAVSGTNFSALIQALVAGGSAIRTQSCYVKAANPADVGKTIYLQRGNGTDLINHVLTADWVRIRTTGLTSYSDTGFYLGVSGASVLGGVDQGACSILMFGAQVELGSFPTSYIPTTGAQVTRAADNISLATSMFPFNAAEGTIIVEFTPRQAITVGNPRVMRLQGIGNNYIEVAGFSGSPNRYALIIRTDVAFQADLAAASANYNATLGSRFRLAGAYAANDAASSANGNPVSTDGTVVVPAVSTLYLGSGATVGHLGGHLTSIVLLPRRVANANLPTMSAL